MSSRAITSTKTAPPDARNGPVPPKSAPTYNPQQRTPPPDNFGYILPCTHLTSVLETKAHDTVMATYRQAVAVSIAINPLLLKHVIYTLKKDGLLVPQAKLSDYKSQMLLCGDCHLSNFYQVFICLQCPHVGCYHDHAPKHAKEHNHLFAIDSHNGLLFCFQCGDYINHAALNRIRLGAVAHCVGGEIPPETDSQDADFVTANYFKPSPHAVQGMKGIVNLGSTCYMSCILQTMLHNPLVRYRFFNNDLHYFNCDSQNHYHSGDDQIDESSACITCLMDTIFKDFFTSTSHEGAGITNLLMTAWYKNQLLAGFQEQDAHEFWQFLLNEFHSDYERVAKKAGIATEPCKCVAHATFSGQLESSVACGSCGAVTKTVDPLVDLSLEVHNLKDRTLYDCLDQFTHNEALDVKYKCQSCQEETKAHRSLRLKKIPPVLSIQLKRFKHNFANDTASKIDVDVEAPFFLNLTKYASDFNEKSLDPIDSNKVYELFAVINHTGLVNTGHYIALIKNSSGQWFKFDDSVISHISHEEVMATKAYLLFYIAHNI